MQFRLAVFDMAGTTVADTGLVAEVLVQTLAAHGYAATFEQALVLMGYPKPEAIARLLALTDIDAPHDAALVDVLHTEFVQRTIARYRTDAKAMPAAEACFAALRAQGVKVALNTAFSRAIADAIVQGLHWQIGESIDDLIATDEVPAGRPAPDMIRTLMTRHGIDDARQVAKIGDTEVDVREGRNAGAGLVVAVTTGAFTREALQAVSPDHVIDSLAELPALLAQAARA